MKCHSAESARHVETSVKFRASTRSQNFTLFLMFVAHKRSRYNNNYCFWRIHFFYQTSILELSETLHFLADFTINSIYYY